MNAGSADSDGVPEAGTPSRVRHEGLVFRPGAMAPMYGETANLLIVDDDDRVARLLASLLGREGYKCTIASDAAEARKAVAERSFAIALVDVMMPGESGLELAADLLATHDDLAVVMVTGIDDPHIAELALQSGAYGYLVKPFQLNQVVITVATAGRLRCLEIERRRYQQRMEQLADERAADLEEALTRLKEADGTT